MIEEKTVDTKKKGTIDFLPKFLKGKQEELYLREKNEKNNYV